MKLIDFIMKNVYIPDFEEQAIEKCREELEILNMGTLTIEKKNRAETYIKRKTEELRKEFEREQLESFDADRARQMCRFGKSMLINIEKVTDPNNTFVLPIFIKPGRTHFLLRAP